MFLSWAGVNWHCPPLYYSVKKTIAPKNQKQKPTTLQ